jgi:hypothetical protein
MRWYHYVAYFFGGAFLANALPHLGNGISGHAFQSPFAHPPGEGLSSAFLSPLRGWTSSHSFPTAYAVGCILLPLRGLKTQLPAFSIGGGSSS